MRALFPLRIPQWVWETISFARQCVRLLAHITLALFVATAILTAGYGIIHTYAVPPGNVVWAAIVLLSLIAAMVAGSLIARSGWWTKKDHPS